MPYTLYYTGKLAGSNMVERIAEETLTAAMLYPRNGNYPIA